MQGPGPSGARGVSLPEALVVLAVIALFATLVVPLAVSKIRSVRTRASVSDLALALAATRAVAVTSGRAAELTLCRDGDEREGCAGGHDYAYTDLAGRSRGTDLAAGLRIVTAPPAIRFTPNGGVEAHEPPVVQIDRLAPAAESGEPEATLERWQIETSLGGAPRVARVAFDATHGP
jgi:prepilin-type N-terminal cleavage/methylation domain-containing protein